MTEYVIVEKTLDTPASGASVEEQVERTAWCRNLYGVRLVQSHLSVDGLRMICLYEAPDAEAVRNVYGKAELAFDRVYTATIHEPDTSERSMACVMVERAFDAPADFEQIQALEDRGGWCLEMHRVRFLRTYFSKDRLRMLCLYDAPDAESVRIAQQKAGMPFERVWTTTVIVPPAKSQYKR